MRFIAVIVFLIAVAVAVGWFAYQNLDRFGQNEVIRWLTAILFVLFASLATFAATVIRYRIPKADVALVRTGGAREKIRITGGLWVNTIIHEIKEISLNTMRIEVIREGPEALITYDFNRGDVEVVFYLKVEPEETDILRAAQALGDKSMTPETVRELIEPKLEGALRSVAAESDIQDLLQKRQEFADKVQGACGEDLEIQNGLTLETVSIIRVDQTPVETLDAENRFDAVGIREITEITAEQEREKERIVQEKEVAIVQIEVDARIQKLEAEQQQAWAESDQQKNIAIYAAERQAETLKFQFEMEQGVQEREYEMKQEVERARIRQEQVIQEREIEMNRDIEVARVQQEQIVAEREIEKNLIVETQQIEQSKVVQLAEIEQHLIVQMQRIAQEQAIAVRDIEKVLTVEKARIAQEEGVMLRDIARDLAVQTARFSQEQQVQQREIEKNLVVETAQIDQVRQVELAEVAKILAVEIARIAQAQQVETRDIEKELIVDKARIAQEEGVMLRDIARDLAVQTTRFSQEQQVQQREIEKNLVVETAQIDQVRQVSLAEIAKILTVEQSRINQELQVALTDEDRKIEVANKQQVTALAEKEQLVAEAERMGAEVGVTATEQVKEAEWQREVAIIGAEAQAQPIERLADAVLAEARAKAQGEMAEYEARNVAEQRVLVQEAILELIDEAPDILEELMKPVEKIDSIKILDMGNNDGQGGLNRSNMGRLANALLDTGAISPMLKELFNFADVDAQQITDKIAEYLSDLVNRPS
ncbi:MAG: SPFH domain-containing protein [Candidatus Poribacteria bacterium]|nr:SPFH domain-containing protein [Candidatus Poribacteria bacterium]